MTPAEVLRHFVSVIETAGTPYMLTGSHASSLHGLPRSTYDLDFVISPTRAEMRRLVLHLKEAGCYVDESAAFEAMDSQGQFNAIDLESGWKADFIICKPRLFSETEFERRHPAELYGVPLIVATAEDVLIAKMESTRQIEDAASIVKARAIELDIAYVEKWVLQLGLGTQWAAVRRVAGVDSDPTE